MANSCRLAFILSLLIGCIARSPCYAQPAIDEPPAPLPPPAPKVREVAVPMGGTAPSASSKRPLPVLEGRSGHPRIRGNVRIEQRPLSAPADEQGSGSGAVGDATVIEGVNTAGTVRVNKIHLPGPNSLGIPPLKVSSSYQVTAVEADLIGYNSDKTLAEIRFKDFGNWLHGHPGFLSEYPGLDAKKEAFEKGVWVRASVLRTPISGSEEYRKEFFYTPDGNLMQEEERRDQQRQAKPRTPSDHSPNPFCAEPPSAWY